ncbi:unnamed protein product [Closterium sp. Naga37s-1]|nr:unnamed protein product [Closterium sp. Naga37s-1]
MVPLDPPSGIVPRATSAAPEALATMAATFPRAVQEEAFLRAVATELSKLGFKRTNSIALGNTCRDEVCRPVVSLIDRQFGLSFNLSGLGGLVNCGKTGFKAAMSHSPEFREPDGTLLIFFAFPHVSIGESGEVGSLLRRGRGRPSSACGALIAIQTDLNEAKGTQEDPFDEEYVLLKKKVASKVRVWAMLVGLMRSRWVGLPAVRESGTRPRGRRGTRLTRSTCCSRRMSLARCADLNVDEGTQEDPCDEEYVLPKKESGQQGPFFLLCFLPCLFQVTNGGPPLSLVQVTRAALAAINEDLEKLISLTVDPATADYAVITGVQIHSGNQLTSPEGTQLHYGERQTEGHFGFRATKAGDHTLCVWLSRGTERDVPATGSARAGRSKGRERRKVDVAWRVGKSKDAHLSEAPRKEQVETFDSELQDLESMAASVADELEFFHERELELQQVVNTTHFRIACISLASLLVCIALTALQFCHLKSFFHHKKLL